MSQLSLLQEMIGMPIVEADEYQPSSAEKVAVLLPVPLSDGLPAMLKAHLKGARYLKELSEDNSIRHKTFGVYPTIEKPLVVFEADSAAQRYVLEHVVYQSPSLLKRWIRRVLGILFRYDLNIAAYLVIPTTK